MRKIIMGAAAMAALALPGTAAAATVPVQSLSGAFSASNSTVTKTPDGVHFGTYADGGALGGSLTYSGMNGQPLSAVTDFGYTFTYRQAGNTSGAAPYARIFLDADGNGEVDNDVILDPSMCATQTPNQAEELTFQMVGNSVRYSDDGCDGVAPDQQPWADVVAAHGDEAIVGMLITQGFSTGTDVSALLRNITVNGTTYAFNVPPADGQDGAPGLPGAAGPQGAAGNTGVTGATGAAGETRIIREFVPVQVPTPDAAPAVCQSGKRVLHVQRIRGARLLSARATLRGKSLRVRGRTVTINLVGQAEGNFNVRIKARYKSAKTGRVFTRTQTRNLSVACA